MISAKQKKVCEMTPDEKKEYERRKKEQWRAKQHLKEEGNIEPSLIDQAKKILEGQSLPDLNSVLDKEEFKNLISLEDKKSLQIFLNNLKARRKRDAQEESKRQEQERQITEKGRIILNKKTDDLQQALFMATSEEDRAKLIKDTIETNLFLFLEFMENHPSPSNDFLKIVVGLESQLDQASFTELFVRVCTHQKIESLRVTPAIVKNAIDFLVDKKRDNNAAYGLLRIIYYNNISLTQFPTQILSKFEEYYKKDILRQFKSLSHCDSQVVDSLPATTFLFTTPVLNAIREGGKVFYTQVPYQFLPYVVEIICYSFNDDQGVQDRFLQVFKDGVKAFFNNLQINNFQGLLQSILEHTVSLNQRFFRNLSYSTTVLERAFSLLRQSQIEIFNASIINDLIFGDHDTIKQLTSRPSIKAKTSSDQMARLVKDCKKANPNIDLDPFFLENELSDKDQFYFTMMGISRPLPLQTIAYNLCNSPELKGKCIVQLETGSGKTALCFTVACDYTSRGFKVLIINDSKELTFRDFRKAEISAGTLGININFIEELSAFSKIQPGITYISYKDFHIAQNIENSLASEPVLILFDEIDAILFNSSYRFSDISKKFNQIKRMIGLTGSDLKEFHVKYIQKLIQGQVFRLSILNPAKPALICHHQKVFTKLKDLRDMIEEICHEQTKKTPVIVIGEDHKFALQNQLERNKIRVEPIWQYPFTESISSLSIFSRKQNDKYAAFIINQQQGRGLDFLSSAEIEEAGGVYLIISIIPNNFLQFRQFLGRTGRIGNKGQYSVIIFDKEAKNADGGVYLEKKLESLENEDQVQIQRQIREMEEINSSSEVKNFTLEKKFFEESKSFISENLEQDSNFFQSSQIDEKSIQISCDEEFSNHQLNIKISNDLNFIENSEFILSSKQDPIKRNQKAIEKILEKQVKISIKSTTQKDIIDKGYFDGYGQKKIHKEMLLDHRRVSAYKDAINLIAKNLVVVDVGAGTGILTETAVLSGAEKVYAIEKSDIVSECCKMVRKNKFSGKVEVLNVLAEEAPIPSQSVDLIVSEWMGYFLLFERMLPSVLSVRDKCLKPEGILIPGRVQIILAGYSHKIQNVKQVQDVPDREPLREPLIIEADPECVSSSEDIIFDLVLKEADVNTDKFEKEFALQISKKIYNHRLIRVVQL